MDVRIESSPQRVADLAADFVVAALTGPTPTIGLATGGTPLATYDELTRRHEVDGLRLDHANYVLLDEYVGIDADHPASYRRFLVNRFRRACRLRGTPIRVELRTGSNPFEGRRNKLWINTLRGRCHNLRHGDVLVVKLTMGSRMCDMDRFEVAEWFDYPWYQRWPWTWGSWGSGATCALGEFHPVTEAQVNEIKAVLDSR